MYAAIDLKTFLGNLISPGKDNNYFGRVYFSPPKISRFWKKIIETLGGQLAKPISLEASRCVAGSVKTYIFNFCIGRKKSYHFVKNKRLIIKHR